MLKVIVGGQFGDEGKGKIISYLANHENFDAIVRAGTGPNAGHTVVHEGTTYKLRIFPSGFFSGAKLYIGAGVLITEDLFFKEKELTGVKEVYLDHHTGVITTQHIEQEKTNNYLMNEIGSTGSGCAPANVDRINRVLKTAKDYESLKPFTTSVSDELNDLLDNGGKILVEGSQATFLSLYHGTYPYVTSKDVCASGCLSDVGIGPTRCDDVILVLKAFITRVGSGPLKGELDPKEVQKRGWEEFGTVTGRLRRAAPFDFDLAKRAARLNGATSIALTKMDIVYPGLKGATEMDQLTEDANAFIQQVEAATRVPVRYISTGPSSTELILKNVN